MLDLEPVKGRQKRHCRLRLRVRFASATQCIISIKDEGFGEMFPSSNRIWEKTFDIA
jgi:hypothetical protein